MRVRRHIVTWYGGKRERVTVLNDETHMRYGFRYGSMRIESDEPTQLGSHERSIHFGLYNATGITEI